MFAQQSETFLMHYAFQMGLLLIFFFHFYISAEAATETKTTQNMIQRSVFVTGSATTSGQDSHDVRKSATKMAMQNAEIECIKIKKQFRLKEIEIIHLNYRPTRITHSFKGKESYRFSVSGNSKCNLLK